MVSIEQTRLDQSLKYATLMGAIVRKSEHRVQVDRAPNASIVKLLHQGLRERDRIVDRVLHVGDDCVVSIGHDTEPSALALIAGEGEDLVSVEDGDLPSRVMRHRELTHVGSQHAIGGDDRAVAAKKRDDNGHCWKMLFAFISG